jgi:hypothetical protein
MCLLYQGGKKYACYSKYRTEYAFIDNGKNRAKQAPCEFENQGTANGWDSMMLNVL